MPQACKAFLISYRYKIIEALSHKNALKLKARIFSCFYKWLLGYWEIWNFFAVQCHLQNHKMTTNPQTSIENAFKNETLTLKLKWRVYEFKMKLSVNIWYALFKASLHFGICREISCWFLYMKNSNELRALFKQCLEIPECIETFKKGPKACFEGFIECSLNPFSEQKPWKGHNLTSLIEPLYIQFLEK